MHIRQAAGIPEDPEKWDHFPSHKYEEHSNISVNLQHIHLMSYNGCVREFLFGGWLVAWPEGERCQCKTNLWLVFVLGRESDEMYVSRMADFHCNTTLFNVYGANPPTQRWCHKITTSCSLSSRFRLHFGYCFFIFEAFVFFFVLFAIK